VRGSTRVIPAQTGAGGGSAATYFLSRKSLHRFPAHRAHRMRCETLGSLPKESRQRKATPAVPCRPRTPLHRRAVRWAQRMRCEFPASPRCAGPLRCSIAAAAAKTRARSWWI